MERSDLKLQMQRLHLGTATESSELSPAQVAELRKLAVDLRARIPEYAVPAGKQAGNLVLFAGPSGTGKAMAAQVLARELGFEGYRIDMRQIVSRYIGETEKNLSTIFARAPQGNAVLFFDEADALFGKRSEVKDSHDRYANIEANYLLQQTKTFPGVVILACNAPIATDYAGKVLNFHSRASQAKVRR